MKRSTFSLLIGSLLILIFALLLFVFQVRQAQMVVVTTFGRPTRQITEPGAYFRLPWGIQMVHRFDQRVQNFEDKFTEGTTKDQFNLLTSVYVGWQITDPMAFYTKFAGTLDPIQAAENILTSLVGSAERSVVGKHPLADFISPEANQYTQIEEQIVASLQQQIPPNYGLSVRFLGLKRLGLPDKVTESVFAQMTSERKVLADKLQYEGDRDAQNIRSDAERRAAEVEADAAGEATRIRAKGEAEAAKYIAVFMQNPYLANFIFRLNALESALKEHSTLIFDRNTPPFDLFFGVSTNLLNK